MHGKAQKTDLRAVQLYEKKEPKIPQDQTLKFSRKKSVKSSMKCTRRCGGQRPCIATPQRLSLAHVAMEKSCDLLGGSQDFSDICRMDQGHLKRAQKPG